MQSYLTKIQTQGLDGIPRFCHILYHSEYDESSGCRYAYQKLLVESTPTPLVGLPWAGKQHNKDSHNTSPRDLPRAVRKGLQTMVNYNYVYHC